MKNTVEKSAETLEMAIDEALIELGVDRDDVDIEVLNEKQGFLGIGRKEVTVKATIKQEDQTVSRLQEFLSILLKNMQFDGHVTVKTIEDRLEAKITGPEMGLLIGKNGETMEALQTIATAVASKIKGERIYVDLDIEGYKARRNEKLEDLANSLAKKAVSTNKTIDLRPMSPAERRVIHMALKDSGDVMTASEGDGQNRRVLIIPKKRETIEE